MLSIHSMRIVHAPIALLMLLVGCASTEGPSTQALRSISRVNVQFDAASDSTIEIRRSERSANPSYKVQITDKDKTDAAQRAARLDQLLSQGFTGRFASLAAAQGLQVVGNGGIEHTLSVRVVWREMSCGPFSCAAQFRVRGDVVSPSGQPVWHFIKMFGQESHEEPMSTKTFDRFARQVLEQMRKDGLIAAAAQ